MGGHYSFPWIAPLTLDTYLLLLSVKQGGIKYGMTRPGIEPSSPGPLVLWCLGVKMKTRRQEK